MNRLAVVPAAGGPAQLLTKDLDRGVSSPTFMEDGRSIAFLVADDRSEYPAEVAVSGGEVKRLLGQPSVVSSLSCRKGHIGLVAATDATLGAIYAIREQLAPST